MEQFLKELYSPMNVALIQCTSLKLHLLIMAGLIRRADSAGRVWGVGWVEKTKDWNFWVE